jgi:flagellin-like hook-associated protein FlgL
MSISLHTNLAANQANFDIARHASHLAASQNELSSGTRLDGAAPDSGRKSLAINLRSALSRTSAAIGNVSNALSYLQAQQAGLLHLTEVLGRMAVLSTQMQDVTQATADVENYASEFVALQREMLSLTSSQFNGNNLFSTAGGAASTMEVFVSEDAKQAVTIERANLATVQTYNLTTANPATGYTPDNYNVTWTAADITMPTVNPITNPTFFSTIEISLESTAQLLASNGSQQGLLFEALNSLRQNTITIEKAHGQAADTDIASSTREMAKASALMESGSLALAKAKELPQTYLELLTPRG